jgi:hypothetical protein
VTSRDSEFGQFAGGFGDALHRLAVLLVDDQDLAQRLLIRAFATVRRRWAGIQSAGAPEAQAVDALVSRLPRRLPATAEAAEAEPAETAEEDVHLRRRQAVLAAWTPLTPRQRASLLFVDSSVASPRLAGQPMPPSLGSETKVETLATGAWTALEGAVRADPTVRDWSFDDDELGAVLADSLRERARELPTFRTHAEAISQQRRHDLNRVLVSSSVVVVLLVLVGFAVVRISTSTSPADTKLPSVSTGSPIDAPAPPQFGSGSPYSGTPSAPALTISAAPALSPAVSPEPPDSAPAVVDAGYVVGWPTRGSLATNAALEFDVRSTFLHDHTGLTGPVQVLLLTDTTTFRVAYVTARTNVGSVGSWFYGNIGDQHLTEGSSQLGFSILGNDSVLSALLVYGGSRELVVLASPTATSMVLHGGAAPVGFLTKQGFGVLDVTQFPVDGLQVSVETSDGGSASVEPNEIDLDLATPRAGGISTAGYPIVRGYPDPGLLVQADTVATLWQTTDLHDQAVPDVLWGGTDGSIQQVVVRLRTVGGIDVVVIAWGGPEARVDAELLAPKAADFPLTWDYPTATGMRVGVLVAPGVKTAQLVVDGASVGAAVPVDANGYASLVEPAYSGTVTGHTVAVAMSDATGKAVVSLSVPPPA